MPKILLNGKPITVTAKLGEALVKMGKAQYITEKTDVSKPKESEAKQDSEKPKRSYSRKDIQAEV
jgi:hypothetical protein